MQEIFLKLGTLMILNDQKSFTEGNLYEKTNELQYENKNYVKNLFNIIQIEKRTNKTKLTHYVKINLIEIQRDFQHIISRIESWYISEYIQQKQNQNTILNQL
ncbi:unnamed protein product [Paramecium sonneborni]|uniref:Uncharacterized protein n=1 Tax=Paramecium sonneborni TaxID=65129 RepID=A0A8S1M7B6_9CILI|nr:unnamed protein product [Paramecium sonneborni]